jgi:hypothetical protein
LYLPVNEDEVIYIYLSLGSAVADTQTAKFPGEAMACREMSEKTAISVRV